MSTALKFFESGVSKISERGLSPLDAGGQVVDSSTLKQGPGSGSGSSYRTTEKSVYGTFAALLLLGPLLAIALAVAAVAETRAVVEAEGAVMDDTVIVVFGVGEAAKTAVDNWAGLEVASAEITLVRSAVKLTGVCSP